MIKVIPLNYGTIFKRAFGQVDIFKYFVKDVLGIDLNISEVHTEYQYPKPIGFVNSTYDLFAEDVENRIIVEIQHVKQEDFFDRFLYYHLISLAEQVKGYKEYAFDRTVYTIVVLTSIPRDGSIDFSCAVSDMNPIDERGNKVNIYPHRLVFLCPRLINADTPDSVKQWLAFIEDSLDGQMDDSHSDTAPFQRMLEAIREYDIDPDVLSEIKDEAAWELAKARFQREGREEGREQGRLEVRLATARGMLAEGLADDIILKVTKLSAAELATLKQ